MKELLKRGIAVHHSGILPIIKEVICFDLFMTDDLFTLHVGG